MAHGSDILSGAEAAVRAASLFANANIFQREEQKGDEAPDDISVYLSIEEPRPHVMPVVVTFRVYPLRVVVVFITQEGMVDETERAVETERRHELADAVKDSVITASVPNVYQIDFVSEDLFYKPPEELGLEPAVEIKRILTVFDFYTFESDLVDGGEYLTSAYDPLKDIDGGTY